MESFFSSLKTERVYRKSYATRTKAGADLFHSWNASTIHGVGSRPSAPLSPVDFEDGDGLSLKVVPGKTCQAQCRSADKQNQQISARHARTETWTKFRRL
jgi:hypothetical protein